jgi:hypothetical protein
MSVKVERLLIDALKPRELSLVELSKAIAASDGVNKVFIVVMEVDSKTETIKITVRGSSIEDGEVRRIIEKYGVSIKGIDEITVTKNIEKEID